MQNFFFEDAVFVDGNMWFFDNCIQAICKTDMQKKKVDIVKCLLNEKMVNIRCIFEWNDNYYLATKSDCKLLVYNARKDNFFWLKPQKKNKTGQYLIFSQNKQIWFIPQNTNGEMWMFDVVSQKYIHRSEFEEMAKQCFGVNAFPIAYSCLYDDAFYFSVDKSIYIYDFNKRKYWKKTILSNIDSVNGVVFDGHGIWATLKNANDIMYIDECQHCFHVDGEQSYSWMYAIENYILILPKYSNNIILIEKNVEPVISVIEINHNKSDLFMGKSQHVNCCKQGEYFYIFPYGNRRLVRIHQKDKLVEIIDLDFPNCYKRRCEVIKNTLEGQEMLIEFSEKDLECFVNTLLDVSKPKRTNKGGKSCNKIWEKIKPG